MSHPMAVTNCNIDMESLIADPNRSIATLVRRWAALGCAALGCMGDHGTERTQRPLLELGVLSTCAPLPATHAPARPQAITTLLKTGNESSIDRLLKQIGGFMGEIADEFKVVVVEAIKALCLKFPQARRGGRGAGRWGEGAARGRAHVHALPLALRSHAACSPPPVYRPTLPLLYRCVPQKYRGLMNFLSNVLREDGGFEYKKAIVDAILVGGWAVAVWVHSQQ